MKKEIADKWVAALREPGRKQRRDALEGVDGSQCCLGVLCRVLDVPTHGSEDGDVIFGLKKMDYLELPPVAVRLAAMWSKSGIPKDGTQLLVAGRSHPSLSSANDDGCTFTEIADAIEANWERL